MPANKKAQRAVNALRVNLTLFFLTQICVGDFGASRSSSEPVYGIEEGGAGIAVRGGARMSAVRPTRSRARVEQIARMETCLFRRDRGLRGSLAFSARMFRSEGAGLMEGGNKEVRIDPTADTVVSACSSLDQLVFGLKIKTYRTDTQCH
jgi:hypothetical protein